VRGVLTRTLAVVGAVLVWLPIVATFVFGAIVSIRSSMFRVDYLMPAELFPVALIGTALLLWASVRARSRRGLFVWGLALMVGLWVGMQVIAVATGLASGETELAGWPMILVAAALAGYTLTLAVVAIAGALLVRDLVRR
jgi:hypothetical protein